MFNSKAIKHKKYNYQLKRLCWLKKCYETYIIKEHYGRMNANLRYWVDPFPLIWDWQHSRPIEINRHAHYSELQRTRLDVFHPDSSSIMEALGGYPTKSSASRAGLIKVLLSVAVCMGSLYLLQSKLSKSRKAKDFYSYEVKDARSRTVSLEKYRGKVCYAIS